MSQHIDAIAKQSGLDVVNSNLANGVYVSDCNNATSGHVFYYADGNTLNKPSGISSWLLIKVVGKSGGFFTQIASEENVINGRIWYRTKSANSFGDWIEISRTMPKISVATADDVVSTTAIKTGIDALAGICNGGGCIDFVRSDIVRGSCIMSLVSSSYGAGILINYYANPSVQKVTLQNDNVTLGSL